MIDAPEPEGDIIPHPSLEAYAKQHTYEVCTWPMHYSDEMCMNWLRETKDTNVILYIGLMNGLTPIVTVGDHKAFIVVFKDKPKQSLPSYLNPSYNNTETEEKHLRDQKGSA